VELRYVTSEKSLKKEGRFQHMLKRDGLSPTDVGF